jgi:hypothetical protein
MAVIVPVDPGGTLGFGHEIGALFGHVHVPPPVVTTATETKVVFAGVASVTVAALQLLGPLLVTTCVYVILFPARTGLGVPLFVTARSQLFCAYTCVVVVLFARFGSEVVAATEDVAVTSPAAAAADTSTTTTIFAEVPDARFAESVQLIVPVPPTAGVVQLHPAGARTESNVVFVGVASVKLTPVAAAGPLLVIVCV